MFRGGEIQILIMFTFVAVTLLAATFAVAQQDTTDMGTRMSSDETNINEYIKAYFKLTGQGNTQESTGKVQPEHIKLRLYSSPEDVFEGTLKDWANILRYPQFNRSLETKFFIHGWLENADPKLSKVLAMLYAVRGKKVNFITVDWREYAYSKDYSYVAQDIVPKVAEYFYPVVEKVMETQGNNRVHLVGFDMGAHIAGIAGKRIQGQNIARITGLSPAGRYYNEMSDGNRLARGDAEYVDVIHTNMGGAGINKPLGDVDFFPNGGRQQPAAEARGDRAEKEVISHMLARNYYIESVELGYAGFIGKKCESYTYFLNQKCALNESEVMGEPVSRKVNGTIYMTVNKVMKPYFSKGIYGLYPYPLSGDSSYTGGYQSATN